MAARILLVDDEVDILTTTTLALHAEGYVVVTAQTGESALHAMRTQTPDLIILDMMLPDFNADVIISEVKKDCSCKNIPIILITALSQKSEQDAMKKLNVDCYMIKPFDLQELCGKIKTLLGK